MDLEKCQKNMRYCIDLARINSKANQYPIAAIVTDQNGKILTASSSSLRVKNDPTNHPEIAVIRKASEMLQTRVLEGCYLYTTLEPCPMCTSAAIWAKMQGLVFGAFQEDAISFAKSNPNSKFSWRQIEVKARDIIKHGTPRLELYEGILRNECISLFFC